MILWTIRQMLSLRQAVMGRARPSELAWGLALGVAIGMVPKGNLVSVMLITLLISLRVNHGIAALAAVAFSFVTLWLDPWTHQLGALLLDAEGVQSFLGRVWNWPLMPWTELNNTVVMGSTVAAGIALVPTYALSVPVFRWIAPRIDSHELTTDPPPAGAAVGETEGTPKVGGAEHLQGAGAALLVIDEDCLGDAECNEAKPDVETQIDVIRLKPLAETDPLAADPSELPASSGQMNEALGYLLRRLRDSRQGKAA